MHISVRGIVAVIATLLVLSAFGTAFGAKINLVVKGKSSYTIVLSKEASASEKHAAEELQRFLLQISGARLPIAVEGTGTPRHMILLGDSKTLRSQKSPVKSHHVVNRVFRR